MKNFHLSPLLCLCAVALVISTCALEKEPDIPTDVNNTPPLAFLPSELTVITHDSIFARARLSSLGNYPILHHGWVWSESQNPLLQDSTNRSSSMDLGQLSANSFEAKIPNLKLGKTYYLRPYASNLVDTIYGPENSIFMGMPKVEDASVLSGSDCFLRLQCVLRSPLPLLGYGIVYLNGSGMPTVKHNNGLATGSVNSDTFKIDLTMLNSNTEYSLRVFALTYYGIGYNKVKLVKTPSSSIQVAFNINTNAEILQGRSVQFINLSAGANSFLWSFGDGDTSTTESPSHTFNTLGFMNVQLAAGNGSCTLTKDTVLKVINPFDNYLAIIPGGTFTMGCTAEQVFCETDSTTGESEIPIHEVSLNSFFLGKTEITQGQWLAVMDDNPSSFTQCGLDCPVETVSWYDVQNFLEKLNATLPVGTKPYRLPTEAEWEYAARGGADASGMTIYAGSDNLDLVGWYLANSNSKPHPVAQKLPNGYGLYDMSGNVWEWVEDDYHVSYNGAPMNGSAWIDNPRSDGRMYRGGSWQSSSPQGCRIPNRAGDPTDIKLGRIGFRLARSY